MKKRRLVAILATVAVVASLFAGCGNKDDKAETKDNKATQEQKKSDVKIGLSTDEGGLNDKSFNQSADKGIKKAKKEFGFEYKALESTKKENFVPHLQTLSLDANSDLTFAIGYQMSEALAEVAKAASDKHFAIVDYEPNKEAGEKALPNVQYLMFNEHEGSFLVGAIAAKMSKTGKIGFIGGKQGPLIGKFEAGYTAGARAVNPNIKVDVRYADSFGDSNKGYELAKAQYGAGADIVYHAAGACGLGLFKAAKEIKDGGKQVWAIGVDQDQVLTITDSNKKPMYADVILTSMIKRVDTATYEATKEVVDGKFEGGKVKTLSLKENGVGIAPTSKGEIPEEFKNVVKQNVPKDVLDMVSKYEAAIKDGTIKVPKKPEEAKKFTTDFKAE